MFWNDGFYAFLFLFSIQRFIHANTCWPYIIRGYVGKTYASQYVASNQINDWLRDVVYIEKKEYHLFAADAGWMVEYHDTAYNIVCVVEGVEWVECKWSCNVGLKHSHEQYEHKMIKCLYRACPEGNTASKNHHSHSAELRGCTQLEILCLTS